MVGQTFETKHCGPVIVGAYINNTNVWVVFTRTGHTIKTTKRRLTASNRPALRDPMAPSVFGVGCIGAGPHLAHENGADTKVYQTWRAMLRRCYYRGSKHHQPSYDGVTVAKEWHNFQAFAEWYHQEHPGDGGAYQLDKDGKEGEGMEYGPRFCSFVTQRDNLARRRRAGRRAKR